MHQPHYLPWLGVIDKLDRADLFVFVDHVQFERKGWQNRNYVKTPQGGTLLTVPVAQRSRDERIAEKTIDEARPWRKKHHRTIEQSYRTAPFWDEHGRTVLDLYARPWPSLAELAIASTLAVAAAFGVTVPWVRSSELSGIGGAKTEMIASLCAAVGASTYLCGSGARAYLDEDLLLRRGVAVEWQGFVHPEYPQLHGGAFVPRLAALDLLLNSGSDGVQLLRAAQGEMSTE